MSEEDRQATELARRRFLTQTVAGLTAASAVGFGVGAGQAFVKLLPPGAAAAQG